MGFPYTFPFILGSVLDKVRPLKLESVATGGDDDDTFPTATDPSEDYIACKGIVFEDDNSTIIEKSADGYIQINTAPTGILKLQSPIPLIIALG